jgi:hypothetical protein
MNDTPKTEPQSRFGGPRGGNILEFYAQEFKPEPSPVDVFAQHVIQWFFAAKHLRFFEVNKLSENPTQDDLASHRLVCSSLITFGEFASAFSRRFQLDLGVFGVSVGAIEAETRLLQNNFKMFHDNVMSLSEAEAVLAEAFPQ